LLPSEFSEVQSYPALKRLLENQVDTQFIDLRTLLHLPQSGLEGGCNFTAASVLFNLIAGSSVCFYNPSKDVLEKRGNRSERFKRLLTEFYPWQEELMPKDEGIEVLYKSARNPLAHGLGLDAPPNESPGREVKLQKGPLDESQVYELEDSFNRPDWISPTIVSKQHLASGAIEIVISVPTLYWGVHRMLHTLFAVPTHTSRANELAELFSPLWDKYVVDSGHGNDSVGVLDRKCDICGSDLLSADGGETFTCPQCATRL
jgi:hypothetical protein